MDKFLREELGVKYDTVSRADGLKNKVLNLIKLQPLYYLVRSYIYYIYLNILNTDSHKYLVYNTTY